MPVSAIATLSIPLQQSRAWWGQALTPWVRAGLDRHGQGVLEVRLRESGRTSVGGALCRVGRLLAVVARPSPCHCRGAETQTNPPGCQCPPEDGWGGVGFGLSSTSLPKYDSQLVAFMAAS